MRTGQVGTRMEDLKKRLEENGRAPWQTYPKPVTSMQWTDTETAAVTAKASKYVDYWQSGAAAKAFDRAEKEVQAAMRLDAEAKVFKPLNAKATVFTPGAWRHDAERDCGQQS